MTRIALAAACWIAMLGGVALYTARHKPVHAAGAFAFQKATGVFSVEVTCSFDAAPDPFALDTGREKPAALLLRANGVEVVRAPETSAGKAIVASPVPAVVVGRNEFFVEAHPPRDQINRSHAVRVRVLRDGETVAERTFWTEPGTPLATTLPLEIAPPRAAEASHGH